MQYIETFCEFALLNIGDGHHQHNICGGVVWDGVLQRTRKAEVAYSKARHVSGMAQCSDLFRSHMGGFGTDGTSLDQYQEQSQRSKHRQAWHKHELRDGHREMPGTWCHDLAPTDARLSCLNKAIHAHGPEMGPITLNGGMEHTLTWQDRSRYHEQNEPWTYFVKFQTGWSKLNPTALRPKLDYFPTGHPAQNWSKYGPEQGLTSWPCTSTKDCPLRKGAGVRALKYACPMCGVRRPYPQMGWRELYNMERYKEIRMASVHRRMTKRADLAELHRICIDGLQPCHVLQLAYAADGEMVQARAKTMLADVQCRIERSSLGEEFNELCARAINAVYVAEEMWVSRL